MRNITKFIILIWLFSQTIFATVITKLSNSVTVLGGENNLIVTIYGDDIKVPNITKVGGFKITGISTESFYNSINGKVAKGKKIYYSFYPDKNSTIRPLIFKVDGIEEETNILNIVVLKPTFNKKNPFSVQISTEKMEYFLGETIKLKVKYKEKLPQDVVDRRYTEPSGDNLWLKGKSKVKESQNGTDYFIEITYFFTPQKIGKIEINSAKMKIGTRAKRRDSWGMFFESTKWHDIISNRINLTVMNSPSKFVGDFDISATIDKNKIYSGEAVNLFLTISGDGNLEDLESFGIDLPNGVIYDEKPTLENSLSSKNYSGVFTQKFAIILENNVTIPSFSIQYFDPNLNKILTKKTKPLNIIVDNLQKTPIKTENLHVEKSENIKKNVSEINNFQLYIFSGISFLIGVILTLIFTYSPFQKFKIWNQLRIILKKDKNTLKLLLPSVYQDKDILNVAEKLEKRIYGKQKIQISKNEIKIAIRKSKL